MGALCGKESSNDAFSQPGRTLSSAPAPQTTASIPASKIVGGPPRTLGGSSNENTSSEDGAGRKAAEAAERRAQESKKVTGPLGRKVLKDKSQTPSQISENNRRENEAAKALQEANNARISN